MDVAADVVVDVAVGDDVLGRPAQPAADSDTIRINAIITVAFIIRFACS
ncbi:MAG: hypothetical protein ACXVIS_04910 [Halobacteriota archaeon]